MRFVFGYYEIKLFFLKNVQINCYDILNVPYIPEKYWFVLEMFLNCSWIFIEKFTCHPEFEYLNNKKSFCN